MPSESGTFFKLVKGYSGQLLQLFYGPDKEDQLARYNDLRKVNTVLLYLSQSFGLITSCSTFKRIYYTCSKTRLTENIFPLTLT